MDFFTEMDLNINLFIQESLRTEGLSAFMKFFTVLNNAGMISILTVLLFLVFRKYRYIGIAMTFSLVIEFILNNLLLKNIIARPRPYEISGEVELLVERANDYSFPSGHTGSVFAVTVVLYLLLPESMKKYGILGILLSALMGYSRLYVGIHYPSDVIGGLLLGCVTAIFSVWLLKRQDFFKRTIRNFQKEAEVE